MVAFPIKGCAGSNPARGLSFTLPCFGEVRIINKSLEL